MKHRSSVRIFSFFLVLSLLFLGSYTYFAKPVKAAEATFGLVRLNRMKAVATPTGGTVCLNPANSDTDIVSVAVSFSNGDGATTGFTLSGTASDFDATVTDLPYFGANPGTQATAFPGIGAALSVVGQTVTYNIAGAPDLTAGTVYCFNFGAGLTPRTTPASNLTGTITTDGNLTEDETATYAVATITEDQIAVTATVPAIFNFALSGTSIGLGNLSATAVTSGNVTATIGTNGKNGWQAWIHNTSNGLYSTLQTSSIIVPGPGTYPNIYDLASTTGYILDVNSGTGSPTVDTAYDGDTADKGGIMQSTFKRIGYKATPGNADTLILNLRAKVTTVQAPSSDYADTLTVAAAGEY